MNIAEADFEEVVTQLSNNIVEPTGVSEVLGFTNHAAAEYYKNAVREEELVR